MSLPRRGTPTRAEDVLGAANPASATPAAASRWWSKDAPIAPAGKPMVPAPRQPVDGGTSTAGLPIRVPMAQLPGDAAGGVAAVGNVAGDAATERVPELPPNLAAEPDPTQVSSVLSKFYSGVHRASGEAPAQPEPPSQSAER
jgi:hypothetical protein